VCPLIARARRITASAIGPRSDRLGPSGERHFDGDLGYGISMDVEDRPVAAFARPFFDGQRMGEQAEGERAGEGSGVL